MPRDNFMTAAEVAAELRLHPVTVQKLCRDGKLRCSRVGRSYRIPRDAFEDYKKGLSVEAKVVSFVPTLEPELSALVKGWLHHLEHGPKPCAQETIKTHRRHFFRYARGLLGMDPNAKLSFQETATERALLKILTRIPVAQFATRYNLFMAVMSFTSFLRRHLAFARRWQASSSKRSGLNLAPVHCVRSGLRRAEDHSARQREYRLHSGAPLVA